MCFRGNTKGGDNGVAEKVKAENENGSGSRSGAGADRDQLALRNKFIYKSKRLEAYSWGQKVVSGIEAAWGAKKTAAWGAKKTEDESEKGWEHFLGMKMYNYMTCQYKSAADRAHDGSKTTHTQADGWQLSPFMSTFMVELI
ncbi:hypothetical protein Tco_0299225 [Tanacetum coccineum]